jgi:cholesterol oxidase
MSLLSDVLILSGRGVGGGSLGYANTLLRAPEAFFRDPQWAGMADWQNLLAPHYATVERMLGAAPNPRLTPADRALQQVADKLGCAETFRMQSVGVFFGEPEQKVPDPYFGGAGPDRTGCRFCGGCMVGCRYEAKNTLDKNYLYLAEQLGVEVFPETTANLVREVNGGGYEVETCRTTAWFRGGRRTFRARRLVLAAGVLGTLDLLFRSRQAGELPRLSPVLGFRVRTNSETLTGATARSGAVDYSEGLAITSSIYTDEVTHIEPVRYPRGSDFMNLLTTPLTRPAPPSLRPLHWLWNIVRHPLDFLRVLWPFGWARRTVILLVMQTLDNSVQVFRRRRWWWPWSWTLASRSETRRQKIPVTVPQAIPATLALAEAMEAVPQSAVNEVLLNTGITAHILGGCPIGPDPSTGVIDGQNRAYGHEGLYVVDGSMIPANLGVNPSLTIAALAELAMSRIPEKG